MARYETVEVLSCLSYFLGPLLFKSMWLKFKNTLLELLIFTLPSFLGQMEGSFVPPSYVIAPALVVDSVEADTVNTSAANGAIADADATDGIEGSNSVDTAIGAAIDIQLTHPILASLGFDVANATNTAEASLVSTFSNVVHSEMQEQLETVEPISLALGDEKLKMLYPMMKQENQVRIYRAREYAFIHYT